MTDKVQKIREEVARIQLYTQSEVLKQVLDYIDKVQEEPVSEDLGEAAKRYALNNTPWDDCADEIQEAFKDGAMWQKQQMMKGLCYETTVVKDSDGDGIDSEYSEWLELEMDEIIELPEGLKLEEGDKVKVIVIKED